jgi:hypothetical protein
MSNVRQITLGSQPLRAVIVQSNYQCDAEDQLIDVETAGVLVTLPANPTIGGTLIEFSGPAAFSLSGGTSPLPVDPLNIAAGAQFFAVFTAKGWLFSSGGGSSSNFPLPGQVTLSSLKQAGDPDYTLAFQRFATLAETSPTLVWTLLLDSATTVDISSTVTFTLDYSRAINFQGGGSTTESGCQIRWTGAAGQEMFAFYGANNCSFSNLVFNGNDLAFACIHLHTNQPAGGAASANNEFVRCAFTNCVGLSPVTVGTITYAGTQGLVILGDYTIPARDEEVASITFWLCQFIGSGYGAGQTFACFNCLGGSNTEDFSFYSCSFSEAQIASYHGYLPNNNMLYLDCNWGAISTACFSLAQGAALLDIVGGECEINAPISTCQFLVASAQNIVSIRSVELFVDSVAGIAHSAFFLCAGKLTIENCKVGSPALPAPVAVEVGDITTTGALSSLHILGCFWWVVPQTSSSNIPVVDSNGNFYSVPGSYGQIVGTRGLVLKDNYTSNSAGNTVYKLFDLNNKISIFNVFDFGGNANGDITAALAAAVAAKEGNRGGTIYIPPGNYVLSAPVDLGTVACTVMGDGFDPTVPYLGVTLQVSIAAGPALTVGNTNSYGVPLQGDFVLKGFKMISTSGYGGGGSPTNTTTAIEFSPTLVVEGVHASNRCQLENIAFEGFNVGLSSNASAGNLSNSILFSNLLATSCNTGYLISQQYAGSPAAAAQVFENCSSLGCGVGIEIDDARGIVFLGGTHQNSLTTALHIQPIVVAPATVGLVSAIKFEGLIFSGNENDVTFDASNESVLDSIVIKHVVFDTCSFLGNGGDVNTMTFVRGSVPNAATSLTFVMTDCDCTGEALTVPAWSNYSRIVGCDFEAFTTGGTSTSVVNVTP